MKKLLLLAALLSLTSLAACRGRYYSWRTGAPVVTPTYSTTYDVYEDDQVDPYYELDWGNAGTGYDTAYYSYSRSHPYYGRTYSRTYYGYPTYRTHHHPRYDKHRRHHPYHRRPRHHIEADGWSRNGKSYWKVTWD